MKKSFFPQAGQWAFALPLALIFVGCASSANYAVDKDSSNPIIDVVRDTQKGNSEVENCATNFYIDGTKVGSFATTEQSDYQLAPGNYTLAVDNCQGANSKYGLNVEIKQDQPQVITLSADAAGKPFIIVDKAK